MAGELRGRLLSSASRAGESLREIESQARTHYELSLLSAWEARGFLAAEWLAERAGAPALLDYYRVAGSSRDWRHAFERAFGLSLERFYGLVDPYIDEPAPPIPHLADDRDEPVLVLLGDIAPEAAAGVRADFEAVQRLFSDRLGAGGADYNRLRRLRRRVGRSRVPDGVLPGSRSRILLRAPRRAAPLRVRAHRRRGTRRSDPGALLLRRGVARRARRREGDLRLPATALPVGELAGDLRVHLRHHRRGLLRGVRGIPRRPGRAAAARAAAPRRRGRARAGGRPGWLEPGDRGEDDHHRPHPGLERGGLGRARRLAYLYVVEPRTVPPS